MARLHQVAAVLVAAPLMLGFDTSRHSVPLDAILGGGPPKDGIPALLAPRFVTAERADSLRPEDRVVGITLGDAARAYPLRILTWHEIVNDVVGARAIAVTYCPLTASAIVFDRDAAGARLTFGVSGQLYQSNLLLYDHQSESLWSQLGADAVTGPRTGARLHRVPAVVTTWAGWRRAHPRTLVLSEETGFPRDYERDPYAAYERSPAPMFPVDRTDDRLAAKARVFGIQVGDDAVAFPLDVLATARRVEYDVGGIGVRVEDDGGGARAVRADTGEPVAGIELYWFAWAAFHPKTGLWRPAAAGPGQRRQGEVNGDAIGSSSIEIVHHDAYWTDLPGTPPGEAGDGARLLVIRGEVRNASARPVPYVKLGYELVDAAGRVVASEDGYTRTAETLKPVAGEATPAAPSPHVDPLASGARDAFRMLFVGSETPSFARYRIRVLQP